MAKEKTVVFGLKVLGNASVCAHFSTCDCFALVVYVCAVVAHARLTAVTIVELFVTRHRTNRALGEAGRK